MSQIRTAKASDLGAFPGSSFVIDNTPPIAQCQETEIASATGSIVATQFTLTDAGKFVGIDLAGKILSITTPPPVVGDYTVVSNTDDVLTVSTPFGTTAGACTYTVHDAAQTYLTRNESSFTRFIENQSKAHTTKGGQLFTDLADPPMDDACSDTWSPE